MMNSTARSIIFSFVFSAIILSWFYFRRYKIKQSSIGIINLSDVSVMIGGVILIPFLYLLLPVWLVECLLAAGLLGGSYFMWEPVLRSRPAIWLISIIPVVADFGFAVKFGTVNSRFFIVNNIILTLLIVGITNLWAQSGMRARDVVVLGGILTIYDIIATSVFPLTGNMMERLSALPFAPQISWCINDNKVWGGIGMGDVLVASVFPLVMRKAFGRMAGFIAIMASVSTIILVLIIPTQKTFPVMVILGPLMIFQYLYWKRRVGAERTMLQYLKEEPF